MMHGNPNIKIQPMLLEGTMDLIIIIIIINTWIRHQVYTSQL